jgi:ribosomal protein S18 acetylase RimI-like enzyme
MSAVEICPLEPARRDGYLRFFDTRAFTDNPRWAGCYCFFPYNDHAASHWHQRTGAENRAAMSSCIASGQARGYLAYRDGEVVGWCNAAPWNTYPMLHDEPQPDAAAIGVIFCFVVAPEHRGQGIARALLDAACTDFKTQGLAYAQARPRKQAATAAENHLGPLSMYLAAGFSILREDDEGNVLVQKRLA